MPLAPGSRLGPYEVLSPLGAGGMGEVWRARDTRLGREVAIKVLPAAFAADHDRIRRFDREAKATGTLDHPNILAIHDTGMHEGSPYLVEELLEGQTLREQIRGGALSPGQAVDYGSQTALGLAAAHEKGIVHRDLKPENLFVTRDGHVKILDFGLAKLIDSPPGPEGVTQAPTLSRATGAGAVLGTVGYMAPEQVRGLPADHRADIFALGCVLYEMLSGQRPFAGATSADTLSAILREDPPPLSSLRPAVPLALQHVVDECLRKRPEDRFSSAHDVAIALRAFSGPGGSVEAAAGAAAPGRRWRRPAVVAGAALAIALFAVGAAAWLRLSRRPAPGAPPAGPKRIAVLPFENLGAAEDTYFADGVTDEVRSKLLALPGLEVIARGSAMQYRGTTKEPGQIARELGTPYLLTATVRWQKGAGGASRIRVTPELVEVPASGPPTTRWQGSFDAELADLFRVQAEIAARVATALQVALGAREQQRLRDRPTDNLSAYEAYLRGQEISGDVTWRDARTLRLAIAQYEMAMALDPEFALAWAKVSLARSTIYYLADPAPALAEAARVAGEQALRLDPDLPEGRLAMGNYYQRVATDLGQAKKEFRRGLASTPDHPGLLTGLAMVERSLGRWEEAVASFERARSMDPRSVTIETRLGQTLHWLRRDPAALAAFDRASALDPSYPLVHDARAQVFLSRGDLAGARAVVGAAAAHVEPVTLAATLASRFDLYWMLDDAQQKLLLRLSPSAFDDNRAQWALVLTEVSALRGDGAGMRRFAEEARRGYADQLASAPDDAERHVLHGLVLAYLGRRQDAIREAERGLTLLPISRDAFHGAYNQHQVVRIHILLGDHEKALDLLEPLLAIPHYLSPGWLSIDPTFAPLRGNPRFEKLLKPKG